MSEEAAATAVDERPAAVPDVAATDAPADVPKVASGVRPSAKTADKPAADPAPDAAPPDVAAETADAGADDWRVRLAGNNEALLKRLKRFESEAAFGKSWESAQTELSKRKQMPVMPGPDASEEDIATYRRLVGIPESPDGYKLKLPEGLELTEGDKATLNDFKSFSHGRHLPPTMTQELVDWYFDREAQVIEAENTYVADAVKKNTDLLRKEFGSDYDINRTLANGHISRILGEDGGKALLETPLRDGVPLGSHPDFIRLVVAAARETADDSTMAEAMTGQGGVDLDSEWARMMDLMVNNPAEYDKPHIQARAEALAKRRYAQGEATGGRR